MPNPSKLRSWRNLLNNITSHLALTGKLGIDATPIVIRKARSINSNLYAAAVAERGAAVIHRESGKAIKKTLGAKNGGRSAAEADDQFKSFEKLVFV